MLRSTISNLPNANQLSTTDKFVVDQTDATRNITVAQINQLYANKSEMETKLEEVNTQMEAMSININNYPRLNGESTDLPRIVRAISSVPLGSTILFPNTEYIINGDIVLNRKVNLKGQNRPTYNIDSDTMNNGVVFLNGKIRPNTDGVKIENIGLFSTTTDNGFEGTKGSCSNIIIDNCITRVRSHGYLFESYNGLNANILIKNSFSYKSTHGFISKAMNVTFDNCKAFYHNGGFGFGSISDNIPSSTSSGIANNNKHINCYAESCDRGFAFYCRDMHSEDNTNKIELKNVEVLNCRSVKCTYPLTLGDITPSTTGNSRVPVTGFKIDNFVEEGTAQNYSVRLGYCINCEINKPILSKLIDYSTNASRISIKEFNGDRTNPKAYNMPILEQNTNYPNIDCISDKMHFKTNNTNTITIKGLMKGLKGIEVTIYINDSNTSILSDQGNIIMSKATLKGVGSYVILKFDGSKWQEIYLHDNNINGGQLNLGNGNVDIDCNNGVIYDIVGTGSTTNIINVINNFKPQLTLSIRSVGGTFSFGGFGDKFITNTIPSSMSFGKVIVCNFVYIEAIKKYACVSWLENNI